MSRSDTKFKGTIAFLDSGVGGFSILDKVIEKLPDYRLIYYFDRKNFPYGTKKDEQVVEFVSEAFQWLKEEYQPSLFVLACNTASTVALPHLRATFKEPIVGVVPSIKPAAEFSATGIIGVLATSGTLQRSYINDLVQTFGQNKSFIFGAADNLVKVAEEYFLSSQIDALAQVSEHMHQIFSRDQLRCMDTVVLGCTHYTHILDLLKISVPTVAHWLDSADAVAKRVAYLLALQSDTTQSVLPKETMQKSGIILSSPLSPRERDALKGKYTEYFLFDRESIQS